MGLSKFVFFGDRVFAVSSLRRLHESGLVPLRIVTSVVDSEEDPEGDAVPEWAREHGVEVVSFDPFEVEGLVESVTALEPEVIVVAGLLEPFPVELLEVPAKGCIRLQASLLPKYRGPEPIRAALSEGEKETGVSTIRMEEEPYAGPVLLQERLEVGERETYGELLPRLAELGSEVLLQTLERLDKKGKGKLKSKSQNENAATEAPRLGKRHRRAPWVLGAAAVFNRVRAYAPQRGLEVYINAQPVEMMWGISLDWVDSAPGRPGTYLGLRQGRMAILCGDDSVFGIERLRPAGEEIMRASDYALRQAMALGDRLV